MATQVQVQNSTAHVVYANGTAIAPNATVMLPVGALSEIVLECPAIVPASCNLLSLDKLVVPFSRSGTQPWAYSMGSMYAGASPCVGGPVFTSGAFSFLTFALLQITGFQDGGPVVSVLPYNVLFYPADALNTMIGNPTLTPAVRGALPCGVFSTYYTNPKEWGIIASPQTAQSLVPNAP